MSDWDAAKYHRVSDPQLAWGRVVAERLVPAAGERILDVGCGTGRLTEEIARTPGITVVGLDRSASMLGQARSRSRTPVVGLPTYVLADGADLPFVDAFDAIFSAATFHWIPDHDRLFRSLHTALKPGGYFRAEKGMQHYAWASAPTVIQIHGVGPFAITYVNSADDPRNKPTAQNKSSAMGKQ